MKQTLYRIGFRGGQIVETWTWTFKEAIEISITKREAKGLIIELSGNASYYDENRHQWEPIQHNEM